MMNPVTMTRTATYRPLARAQEHQAHIHGRPRTRGPVGDCGISTAIPVAQFQPVGHVEARMCDGNNWLPVPLTVECRMWPIPQVHRRRG